MDKMPTPSSYTDLTTALSDTVRRDAAKALETEIFKQFEKPMTNPLPKPEPYSETGFAKVVDKIMQGGGLGIPSEYIAPMGMTGMGKTDVGMNQAREYLKTNNVDELKRLINQTDNEFVIKILANKLGRQFSYDRDSKRVLEYISRLSIPYYKEMKPEGLSDDNLSMLEYHLQQIPGVSVQVIFEYYPDEASIIVRVDHRALTDDELETVPARIQDAIKEYKPKGLRELEVIYHNKEVY